MLSNARIKFFYGLFVFIRNQMENLSKISKFFSSDFLFPPQTKSRQRIALFQVVPETIVVKRQKEKAIGGGIKVMTMTRKRLENIHIICFLVFVTHFLEEKITTPSLRVSKHIFQLHLRWLHLDLSLVPYIMTI